MADGRRVGKRWCRRPQDQAWALTLQLCTSCCCAAGFLLEDAACCAAAMVWVAEAAACLAACWQRKEWVSTGQSDGVPLPHTRAHHPLNFSPLPPPAILRHPSILNAQCPKATRCMQGMEQDGKGAVARALCSMDTVHENDFIPLESAGMWKLLARSCSLTVLPHPPQPSILPLAQHLTSSLCTSFFLMAFWAAALVAMRSPSAASRSRCCCSSLSGWAAAPWRNQETHHTFQGPLESTVFTKQQLCIGLMLSSIPRQPDYWGDAKSLARRAQQQLLCYHPQLEEPHSIV